MIYLQKVIRKRWDNAGGITDEWCEWLVGWYKSIVIIKKHIIQVLDNMLVWIRLVVWCYLQVYVEEPTRSNLEHNIHWESLWDFFIKALFLICFYNRNDAIAWLQDAGYKEQTQ